VDHAGESIACLFEEGVACVKQLVKVVRLLGREANLVINHTRKLDQTDIMKRVHVYRVAQINNAVKKNQMK
jgi:hypothetical protein